MISKPLMKQSIKANWVIWTAMTAVMVILNIQFASLELTKPLLFLIFYGIMATILPGVYVLITANKLIASQVDRGSMAYILSRPTKRSKVVITQMIFLIGTVTLMFVLTTIGHILVNASSPLDLSVMAYSPLNGLLTSAMIIKINFSALLVSITMAGVCFMFSGVFNLTKYSVGLSGTFVGVSILANMLAMFGNIGVAALSNFKYLTICTFYDYQSILVSGDDWIWKLFVSLGIAIVTFTIGAVTFTKKDLPL